MPPGTNVAHGRCSGQRAAEHSRAQTQFGDPDVNAGSLIWTTSSVAHVAGFPEVAPGFFVGLPEPLGPFGSGPITGATLNLAALANTYLFDTGGFRRAAGDAWAQSVDPNATYTPVSIGPGETGTIQVTITPTAGRPNRVVHGFIGVDTIHARDTASGDEVQVIPYTYRIG